MLPYVERQLIYWLLSGLTTLLAWGLLGRVPALATPRRRALATALALALPTVLWMVGARLLDDWHSTYQFIGVAHGFYVGTFWLPLVALVVTKRRVAGASRDWPLVATCLGLIGLGAYALFLEPNRLVLVERTVSIASWPADNAPLRLVHISDLQTVGPCARNRRAAELINGLAPDLIVLTGDYVAGPFDKRGGKGSGERDAPVLAEARRFLGELRPKLGLVCIAGHSESEAQRREIFEGLDLLYLANEQTELDLGGGRRLNLFGITALGAELGAFRPRSEPGLATVFASHMPDVSTELEGLGVDLHLAGHTHGGQVSLPFFGAPFTLSELPRKYARGLHRMGDHWLNVSPGIGMEGNHAPRFRFLCPPEIDLLLLQGSGTPVPER